MPSEAEAAPSASPTHSPRERKPRTEGGGSAFTPPPPHSSSPELQGRGRSFFPRVEGRALPRSVSRVLFRCRVAPATARIIHLGDALLRRSSALTRALAPRSFGRTALDSVPIRACSGRGLPRRRSPGCRAWALTPRFQPCLCLLEARLSTRSGSMAIGGVVSAALSLGSPRVAVSDLPVLWSPDFPPVNGACSPAIPRPPPAKARIYCNSMGFADRRTLGQYWVQLCRSID